MTGDRGDSWHKQGASKACPATRFTAAAFVTDAQLGLSESCASVMWCFVKPFFGASAADACRTTSGDVAF